MAAIVVDGRLVSDRLKPQVRTYGIEVKERYGATPGLATIVVGSDPASAMYAQGQQRLCGELGLFTQLFLFKESVTTDQLVGKIHELNADGRFTGILVQPPLPETLDKFAVFDAIDPCKDVDALTPTNTMAFYRGREAFFLPCTPRGILTLLDFYRVPTQSRDAVVIGRNDISGKPLALILGGRLCNATVVWCHKFTRDLSRYTREADIVVSCVGKEVGRPFLITAEMVKEGAVVIDVGIRRVGERLLGDVDFEAAKEKVAFITPVPGGVGPMTVMSLMQNLVDATRYAVGLPKARYSLTVEK